MYIENFHAHICIRSKTKHQQRVPQLSMEQVASARYVLFNSELDKLSYPLRLDVFKSRVDIWLTDFAAHLRNEYPSIEYVPGVNTKSHFLIHDEFDIIKFLLMYDA